MGSETFAGFPVKKKKKKKKTTTQKKKKQKKNHKSEHRSLFFWKAGTGGTTEFIFVYLGKREGSDQAVGSSLNRKTEKR